MLEEWEYKRYREIFSYTLSSKTIVFKIPKSGLSKKAVLTPLFGYAGFIEYAKAETVQQFVGKLKTVLIQPIETIFISLATLLFLWGLYQYIAGASSEEARTKGKEHMVWGIVGLVIIFSVNAIINILKSFFS